jgi:methyl-accepting chemotaxis protein
MVVHLQKEIEEIKTEQMKQYMKDYRPTNFNTPTMEDAEIFSAPALQSQHSGAEDVSAYFGEDMTASQKQSLLTIQERAAAFDDAIESIGHGVEDLRNLAAEQNEEVKKQNLMLENMSEQVDGVARKMGYINKRMKRTLKEVGRAGDKLCVDIFCVVLAVGLFAVIWKELKVGNDLFGD